MAVSLRRPLGAFLMVPVIGTWLAVTAVGAAAADASTDPIAIGFEQDTPGGQPAGFTSVDSPLLAFDTVDDYPGGGSDCDGVTTCTLIGGVSVLGMAGVGDSQSLSTQGIGMQALRITFAQPTQFLRLRFGDADQTADTGEAGTLTGFFGGVRVGSASVLRDQDSLTDQVITLKGFVIDSAIFQFTRPGTEADNAAEIIDGIQSDPLCSVFGNNAANTLNGTADVDVICGGPGADILRGFGDGDLLYGNGGPDTLLGGAGKDRMFGGAGFDRCNGGTQADTANSCESRTSVP
jgi:Ca2+-binding RTX toxin-like protein